MESIKSNQNKHSKLIRSLHSSKGIKKEKKCLVAGKFLIKENVFKNLNPKKIHFLESSNPDLLIEKTLFKELNPLKDENPFYICSLPNLESFDLNLPPQNLEVMLPVGDPKNLGALIRTSLAFNVKKIILLKEAAHPFLPESIKSSAGSVFNAPLVLGPSLKELNTPNFYALDKVGEDLKVFANRKESSLRILIGEEGGGLNHLTQVPKISIPISNQVESLNVNSCLSIVLYTLSLKDKP